MWKSTQIVALRNEIVNCGLVNIFIKANDDLKDCVMCESWKIKTDKFRRKKNFTYLVFSRYFENN